MEGAEPQRQGWFAWLRGSIWAQPERIDRAGEGSSSSEMRLSANSAQPDRRPQQSREHGDDEGRRASGRRREEQRLKRDLPLVWTFLQGEGWRFVNQHNWDVGRPARNAEGRGACRGGAANGNGAPHGPMPQGQLPAYLLDHPDLLEKYKKWVEALPKASPPGEESDGASDDDWGGVVENGHGSRMFARAPAVRNRGGGGGASAATAGGAPPLTLAPALDPGTAGGHARAGAGGAQRRQVQQRQRQARAGYAAPQGSVGSPAGSPPAARATCCSRSPSRRLAGHGGGVVGGGGTEGGAGRKSRTRPRKGSPTLSSSPLALRTRSRDALRRGSAEGTAAQAEGTAAGGAAVKKGGRETIDVDIEMPPRARPRRTAVASSPASRASIPPRCSAHRSVARVAGGAVPGGSDGVAGGARSRGTAGGVGSAGASEVAGWLRQEEGKESGIMSPSSSPPLPPPPPPPPGRRQGQEQRQKEVAPPSSGKTKKRRQTLMVVPGDGVAGRLVGSSGRRAGAAGKRRRSSIEATGSRGTGGEAGVHDPPSPAKRPRVKVERTGTREASLAEDVAVRGASSGGGGGGSGRDRTPPESTRRRGNPSIATRRRSTSVSASVAAGGGGGGGGGGGAGAQYYDPLDPLAPYARIEAETVSDDGLEDLLHTEKREGFLDLRRFRKPGWPRPLRITRLEASHGKRFEEHLLLLLEQSRRVEATIFLRRLVHYDRNPPHLAASLLGGGGGGGGGGPGGRGRVACIPAWYQEISSASGARPGSGSSLRSAGGGEDDEGIEEVVDLTEKEVEVVECLDNDPVDCVMTRIIKKEPGVEDAGGAGAAAGAAAGGGANDNGADTQRSSAAATAAGAGAGAWAGATTPAAAAQLTPIGRVKMEVD